MKRVAILGSTGTVGVNTLSVLAQNTDQFCVDALSANTNVERLAEQCAEWQPRVAVMADADCAQRLSKAISSCAPSTEVLAGQDGLCAVASDAHVDYVMAGIVGGAGLLSSLAAARAGKRLMLANKEALVMSGHLFMDAVRANGAELLPIDSEHNAIFQCMAHEAAAGVRRILLTGSGGPFRTTPIERLAEVSPEQACAHPNWVMGRKISVDSATMMNKGLEVIEACWLFDTNVERIEVVVHPQSIIHSMVEYVDGSVLAELGMPDMRTPIAHALAWPDRIASGVASLDLITGGDLTFEAADFQRFPCLRLGIEAARANDASSTVLNAANEIAVAAFLEGDIPFTEIPRVIESTLNGCDTAQRLTSVEAVLEIDGAARAFAVNSLAGATSVRSYSLPGR